MALYTKQPDKQSGDGLALTEWNDLSNAVAGHSGLTLAINPADKVGIGTKSPEAKLHLKNARSELRVENTDANNWAFIRIQGSGSNFWDIAQSGDRDILEFRPKGTDANRVAIKQNGNVGIGITDPQATLDVNRGAGGSGTAVFRGTNRWSHFNYSTDEATYIRGGKSNSNVYINDSGGNVGIGTTSPSAKLEVSGDVKATEFIGDGSQLTNLSVGATGLNIATTSGSKVGIGTSSPVEKLEIVGDLKISTTTPWADTRESNTQLFFTDHNFGIGSGVYGDLGGAGATVLWSFQGDRRGILFASTKNGRATKFSEMNHHMFIHSENGNVGIGTTSPGAPLSIATAAGKERDPDSALHMTNDCILFGGNNNGRQTDSAQISAGMHVANSLNIVGMSSNQDHYTRRIHAWAEGGFNIQGNSNLLTISTTNHGLVFHIRDSYHGGGNSNRIMSWDGDSNWDSNSDKKLKTDIETEGNILERLMQLEVKNFRWKDAPKRENKPIGFIAQDVKPWFPALVGEVEDPETKESTLTLKYANFGVLAVGAIQELKREYDERIAALEGAIADLKKQLDV